MSLFLIKKTYAFLYASACISIVTRVMYIISVMVLFKIHDTQI